MTATNGEAPRPLPPVTVARFEEATRLLDVLADEQSDVFLARLASYSDRRRAATTRLLTPVEAAQVASALAAAVDEADPAALAERVQHSGLRAQDEPEGRELLLAAGAATAPAFVQAALRFVALIEMHPDTFREAREAGRLEYELDKAATDLADNLPLEQARERASVALNHLSQAVGVTPGEAWRLLTRTVWQAFEEAIGQLVGQRSSSLTGSLEPTDGHEPNASTESPSEKP